MPDESTVQDMILPVTKSFVVQLPITAAFRLFTSDIGRWWPLNSHSVFGDAAVTCAIEGQIGGRSTKFIRTGARRSGAGSLPGSHRTGSCAVGIPAANPKRHKSLRSPSETTLAATASLLSMSAGSGWMSRGRRPERITTDTLGLTTTRISPPSRSRCGR